MRRNRNSILIILTAVFMIVGASLLTDPHGQLHQIILPVSNGHVFKEVTTSQGTFQFEIVTTTADQATGLGGRAEIPHDYGMLFVFNAPGDYGFWMKDMAVPIDIIWLSDTGAIVGIEDSVPTNSYPHVFNPPQPVRYVLETAAGEASAQGWTVGSTVPIPLQK